MIKTALWSLLHNSELFSGRLFEDFREFNNNRAVLATTDFLGAHARFKSATRTGAGTTTLVTPVGGGSLVLLDLLISGEKQASSSTEIRFTDGTNSESIFLASAVDVPPNITHSFRGRVQGWKDARLDFITVGTADATVTAVYVKVDEGIEYAAWDALR